MAPRLRPEIAGAIISACAGFEQFDALPESLQDDLMTAVCDAREALGQ
jgi:hypothetical protein